MELGGIPPGAGGRPDGPDPKTQHFGKQNPRTYGNKVSLFYLEEVSLTYLALLQASPSTPRALSSTFIFLPLGILQGSGAHSPRRLCSNRLRGVTNDGGNPSARSSLATPLLHFPPTVIFSTIAFGNPRKKQFLDEVVASFAHA